MLAIIPINLNIDSQSIFDLKLINSLQFIDNFKERSKSCNGAESVKLHSIFECPL